MFDDKFWHDYFKVYDILNVVIPYRELLGTVCDELGIKRGEKILEAGSGTGNLALEIKRRGGDVVSIDNSKEGIKRHILKDAAAKVVFGDLTKKLPFPDNYFDKICSNNTLYTILVSERNAVMKEFYRILKPGGKIVISNLAKNYSPLKIYFGHIKKSIKYGGLLYTIKNIAELIVPTIKMFYYNFLIKKQNKGNNFSFFDTNEQKELLRVSSFTNISENKKIFSDQAVMNCGFKL